MRTASELLQILRGIKMIKLIGLLLIIFSGLGLGLHLSAKEKRHLSAVFAIEKMFNETQLMLRYEAVTFKELIAYLKKSSQTHCLEFLQIDENSPDLRQEIIASIRLNKDNLYEDEVFQLEAFFSQFGATDLFGQIALAEKYGENFRERLELLHSESRTRCRLYNSLGILGGTFIAIMVI